MQSSTPTGQFSHPTYSVHALKPLTKILTVSPLGRKPVEASRQVPAGEWSTDLKYRRPGLIAAEMAEFLKNRGQRRDGRFGGDSARNTVLQPSFRPISRNFWRRC